MVRASRGRGGESCWGLSQARAPTRSTLELWLQVAFRSTKPPSGGATAEFRPGSETSKQQLEELGGVAMLCHIGETVESETGNILDFYTLVMESQVERQQILFEPFQLELDRLPILYVRSLSNSRNKKRRAPIKQGHDAKRLFLRKASNARNVFGEGRVYPVLHQLNH